MRQIRFRAQRKDNKCWVYGYLSEPNIINVEVNDPSTGFFTFDEYEIIPETIGQYAERLDVDLRDVYEGDIVQGENGKMWEVVFENYSWMISNERIKNNGRNKFGGNEAYTFEEYIRFCKKAKVDTFRKIGTIHSTPELLNQ